MGMSSAEFWDSTAREFFIRLKSFFEFEQFRQQQEWIRTRWLATVQINFKLPTNKKITPRELTTFEWEKTEEEKAVMSPEISQELNDKWDEEMKRQHEEKKLITSKK